MPSRTAALPGEGAGAGAAALAPRLQAFLETVHAGRPVSVLDVSPGPAAGLALAQLVRGGPRRVRVMSYDWRGDKPREAFASAPELLVEAGRLPGVHFSDGAFDVVYGIDVLSAAEPGRRVQVLRDLGRTALRLLLLAEAGRGQSVTPAALRDLALEAGLPAGVHEEPPLALVEWRR